MIKLPLRMYMLTVEPMENEVKDRLNTYIKSFNYWSHYSDLIWMFASEKSISALTDIIKQFELYHNFYSFVLVDISDGNVNGVLPKPAWSWLHRTLEQIKISAMENPTLSQLCDAGLYDKEFKRCKSIADIDQELSKVEPNYSHFDIENVRKRMVNNLRSRQQFRWRLLYEA